MKTDKAVAPISLVDGHYPGFKNIKGLSFHISIVMCASNLTDDDMLQRQADAERIVTSWNAHDPMYELIEQFGTAVTDMFEQMLKSGWTDDHGHDVKMNAAMIALKKPVEDAIALRAALAKAGAA